MTIKRFFIFYTICLILSSCDSPCNTPITAVPLGFDISDSTKDNIFSQQYLGNFPRDSVKLYYIDQYGMHKDSIDIGIDPASGQYVFSVTSWDALSQSVSGIKTFYFKRNYNVIDTIFFDERQAGGSCHYYKLYSIKYNGIDITNNGHSIVVKR